MALLTWDDRLGPPAQVIERVIEVLAHRLIPGVVDLQQKSSFGLHTCTRVWPAQVMERVIEVFGQPQPRAGSATPRPRPAGRAAILGAASGAT